MIGIQVTQARINEVLGGLAKRLNDDFHEVDLLKAWSDVTDQPAIEAIGFTQDEAYLVKLIIDELNQLRTIYEGTAALANPKDFREQPQKAIGLGI
jgi:hypothetical protein